MHKWTKDEGIAVLALTKKHGKNGWEEDPLTQMLLARGISKGSIGMAVQNNLYLMGLPGGLKNSSNLQKDVFREYKTEDSKDLWNRAAQLLDA